VGGPVLVGSMGRATPWPQPKSGRAYNASCRPKVGLYVKSSPVVSDHLPCVCNERKMPVDSVDANVEPTFGIWYFSAVLYCSITTDNAVSV